MNLVPFGPQIATRLEAMHVVVSTSMLSFVNTMDPDVTGLPPVEISQSHITTSIGKLEYLPVRLLSQDRHSRQRKVPTFVAFIKHSTNTIHG